MQVKEIMTKNPMCAAPNTNLQQVAKMMIDCNCGGIPVCDVRDNKLIGFVTDRDIVCRVLAQGINPLEKTVQDAMSSDLHTVTPDTSIDECIKLMERFKVRRVPVVDQNGMLAGIIAQADLLRVATQRPEMKQEVEEALEEISEPKASV